MTLDNVALYNECDKCIPSHCRNVETEVAMCTDDCVEVGDDYGNNTNSLECSQSLEDNYSDSSSLLVPANCDSGLCDDNNFDISQNIYSTNSSKYENLTVMSWNIQGIGQKLELNEIRSLLLDYDIVFLFETMKLDTFDPQFEGYQYFHFQRKYKHPKARRPSGGIAVLIKSDIYEAKTITIEKANENFIWLKIKVSMQEVFLGGVYIPPEGSTSYLNDKYGKDLFHEL